MRSSALLAAFMAACASAPPGPMGNGSRAVFAGTTVRQVREAATASLNDLSRFIDPARVTEDGRVVTEYAASGWTSFEVRFAEREDGVEVEVRAESKPTFSCSAGRWPGPVSSPQFHAARAPIDRREADPGGRAFAMPRVAYHRTCRTVEHGNGDGRERSVLDGIRARLESRP